MKALSMLSEHSRPIGAGLALWLVWLFDVFTVHGLLTALGLDAGTGLHSVWATRIVWWLLFYVAGSAFVSRLMWREALLSFTSHRQLWAASHVDAGKRLARRVAWWRAGIAAAFAQRRAHRPVEVPAGVPDASRTVSDRRIPEPAPAAA